MKTKEWLSYALCKGMDTNDFYPEPGTLGYGKAVAKMKALCKMCPVKTNCLDEAIKNKEKYGIWGGLLPRERNNIAKSRLVPSKEVSIKVIKDNDNSKV